MNTKLNIHKAYNEPVREYAPGSTEVKNLLKTYKDMYNGTLEVPQYIGNKVIKSDKKFDITPPHDHKHVIGHYYMGETKDVHNAIDEALKAKEKWANTTPEQRASIFLKVAELAAGPYRDRLAASTMLAQSKNVHQTEIDSVCELVDFFRYNVEFMQKIYSQQPESIATEWNKLDYRPLEGFVLAISPFNFTAIAANLPAAPALMGNTVVWKPSLSQLYSAQVIMEIFKEAGVPDGVINMIITDPEETSKIVFDHKEFAGLHFTGSTFVFKEMWKTIGGNIHKYRNYPRIVGETGGKDFIWAHPTASPEGLTTAIIRGGFEFQGQKCSAASRVYVPKSIWSKIEKNLVSQVESIKVGSPEDPSNFVTAVIHKGSFDKIKSYIDHAKENPKEAKVIAGGVCDDSKGYFVKPTLILCNSHNFKTMQEEIFGPVVSIWVYEDDKWEESLKLVNSTSDYALTGAIFSQDTYATQKALNALRNAAGNTYINDKPTGAVVGKQPFGGSRASGTNDKAGSEYNLLRWVSPRLIKENLLTPKCYKYPYLG